MTLLDETDDFPWDAPIRVINPHPTVDSADKVQPGHTAVPVEWMRDERLSMGARAILVETLAHGGNWDISPEELAKQSPDPEEDADMVRGWIAELEEYGYFEKSGT
ncbi:MAG TPA: hypothetical protein VK599_21945 [Streptosporangiaceae bacterium]|nr:hypothetical protein [Streptosporangiaceae bacterium]